MMGGDDDAVIDAKKIHPFFSAPKPSVPSAQTLDSDVIRPVTPDSTCSPGSDKVTAKPDTATTTAVVENEPTQDRRKRRKTESDAEVKQPAKRGRPKGKAKPRVSTGSSVVNHFGHKEDGIPVNIIQVKEANEDNNLCATTLKDVQVQQQQAAVLLPPDQAATSVLVPEQVSAQEGNQQVQDTKPKKILKFNPKTGTIGSPPKPKPHTIDEVVATTRPVGRPRRTKKATSLIACIQYGVDEVTRSRMAEKVEEILSGVRYISARSVQSNAAQSTTRQTTPPVSSQETSKNRVPKKTATPKKAKVAHPFFSGKLKTPAVATADAKDKPKSPVKRLSIFTSTPCSPRQIRQQASKFNLPQFGMKSGGFKFPGAQHAAWPPQGMVHVHGDERDENLSKHDNMPRMLGNNRKAKGRQVELPRHESVMVQAEQHLCSHDLAVELRSVNTEDFLPAPSILRVPGRHFESGKKLQVRIAPELRSWTPNEEARMHPVIISGFKSLATTLPAFDRSTCESVSWTQKYSPIRANQVLQSGMEAELLRDWLQTLKVQSVDTGISDNITNPKPAPVKKKKRKKLDDFIVSGDEEGNIVDEGSEDETAWLPADDRGISKKTIVRGRASKDARLTNAVLLSGPHGCGKTATIHAIAKELDFEIFEISPGSRRNGKDIIEKIGDMTRNHQVSHRQEPAKPEDAINEDEIARDIQSGKQGMMTSFFRPKAEAQPKAIKKLPDKGLEKILPDKATKKLSSKAQKQSLILLEEVDILYEEDKQFWTTVINLMAQSKRPFIMTCNNEKLVPLQSLNLHGIFRFSPAPKDLAVDHLLLIAANEGHALRRNAVASLYESRNCDLRACITELNYWCQIGIGDPKGGFDWFYPKWPQGADLDEQGDRIRVISTATYQEGMGWLGRDALSDSVTSSLDEEIIRQTWENWSLDTGDCNLPAIEQDQAGSAHISQLSHQDRIALLTATDAFYDSLSMADVASYGAYSSRDHVLLDPALPSLTNKVKEDLIIGLQFLEAPLFNCYDRTNFDIAACVRSLSYADVSQSHPELFAGHGTIDELGAVQKIRESFTKPSPSSRTISRFDYSLAFDPIAASEKAVVHASGHLDPSVFDRTMNMITLDIAPFVRSIVAYDQRLQAERLLRSNILSEGGKPKKRMRSTRSALSALEGSTRASTRKEKYFSADVNPHLVMRTGGKGWDILAAGAGEEHLTCGSPPSSIISDEGMSST